MSGPIVAGIDVGNSTTEIVLMDGAGTVRWHGTAPTVGRKGSRSSLAAAARLLARGEVESGLRADLLALAMLRPVDTAAAVLPARPVPQVVRNLARTGAGTPAGHGFAVGRMVSLSHLSQAPAAEPVVVVIDASNDFDDAAGAVSAALTAGWPIVGVLLEADEAVLVAHRLPSPLPVVDEVDLAGVSAGVRVALEVAAPGTPLRTLTDPLAVAAALGVDAADQAVLAAGLRELTDAPAAALILAHTARAVVPDTDWVQTQQQRLSFAAIRDELPAWAPGTVRRLALAAVAVTDGGLDVADAWLVDLAAVDDASWLRRGTAELRSSIVALLSADVHADAADVLAEVTGRRVVTASTEHTAAAVGVRTTPAFPDGAVVCDIGGGTVDCIGTRSAIVAAGAGEMTTQAVSVALGIPPALAERVKRGSAVRVDAPQLVHEEDGRRTFLSEPAAPNTIGRLCVRAESGLVAFTDRLAAEEWRSLRLAIKRSTVGASLARALAALDEPTHTVVLAGGGALDDEVVRSVAEALRERGTVVARADIAGRFGPRFAVAWGLAHLASINAAKGNA